MTQAARPISVSALAAGVGNLAIASPAVKQEWEKITPESVLKLQKPTDGYLCPLNANIYAVEFLKFEVKDYTSGRVVYEVARELDAEPLPDNLDPEIEDLIRSVKYSFPAEFLSFKTVRTALVFHVGPKPLNSFRMIERHYFKNELVRSFDFTFGFCMPDGTNSWEAIYDVPEYTPAKKQEYMSSPFGHKSDSFYFVDDKMIMHNKAEYQYVA